jgi:hypothetical protein
VALYGCNRDQRIPGIIGNYHGTNAIVFSPKPYSPKAKHPFRKGDNAIAKPFERASNKLDNPINKSNDFANCAPYPADNGDYDINNGAYNFGNYACY